MGNSSDNTTRERGQELFNQNVELESRRRRAARARIPSDPNAWQRMRENFESILLEDHGFSEQHDIEYALWQLHYKRIEELRALFNAAVAAAGSNPSQNGKVPSQGGSDRVAKIRSQFKTFLTEATGFYHNLMLKIRAKYGLALGNFFDHCEDQISVSRDANKSVEVKKCLISCHRCFIYLGDLARYKGLYGEGDSKALDFATASSYYIQAASLCPSSGNPHHQLAIVASYDGDDLVSIYRYFRSLAVDSPFTTARDNLIIAFEKNRQNYSQLAGNLKASSTKTGSARTTFTGKGKGGTRFMTKDKRADRSPVKDKSSSLSEVLKLFKIRFVRLNGILFTRTSLETFGEVFSLVRSDFLELLSSGPDEEHSFGPDSANCKLTIVRLIAILIFTIHNVNKEAESQSYSEILQRSVLLQNAFTASFEFMGLILERCSQLNDPSMSYLLPGIMVFIEWLACHQDIAVGGEPDKKQSSARLFFWKHCITFFNKIMSSGHVCVDEDEDETCFVNMSTYDENENAILFALPEDVELRGYLPLLPAQVILDFSNKHSHGGDEKKARIRRIIAAGRALANVVHVGGERVYLDRKLKKFLIGVEPQVYDDYSRNIPETANFDTVEMDKPPVAQTTPMIMQPKPQLCKEVEEEDEVIVFKPPMAEKHVGRIGSVSPSANFLAAEVNAMKVNVDNGGGTFYGGLDVYPVHNAFNLGSSQTVSVQTGSRNLQPSREMTEPGALMNVMAHLNLRENGPSQKSENCAGALQPHPLPVSLPQPAYIGDGCNGLFSEPQTMVPSKFDLIMSEGAESLLAKPLPVMAAGSKKNPITRPVRHAGPPPGFGSLPSKTVDETAAFMSSKTESTGMSQVDDYRWLDGYQLPAVSMHEGLNGCFNQSGNSYYSNGKSINSIGTANFPFPGKQVPELQSAIENVKDCQDFRFSDQMRLLHEQVHQLSKVNQQSVVLPQQYQGQSLWEGGLFG